MQLHDPNRPSLWFYDLTNELRVVYPNGDVEVFDTDIDEWRPSWYFTNFKDSKYAMQELEYYGAQFVNYI